MAATLLAFAGTRLAMTFLHTFLALAFILTGACFWWVRRRLT
jgi:hypothetical protein